MDREREEEGGEEREGETEMRKPLSTLVLSRPGQSFWHNKSISY